MKTVIISGSFDDMRSQDIRFLEEASKLGYVHALVWSDNIIKTQTGEDPKFPLKERLYMLDASKYVDQTAPAPELADTVALPADINADIWAVHENADTRQKQQYCETNNLTYHVITSENTKGYPSTETDTLSEPSPNKKVIVTGCFDWFHSGHIRFFEEVSKLGDLYVAVGNDENVRLLKGKHHPMFNENERRYVANSIRFVKKALITSGLGWMDAAPDIAILKPDIYAVNEDGDKPEKQTFCKEHSLEYVVLKRTPKEGLPRRESTVLRGF